MSKYFRSVEVLGAQGHEVLDDIVLEAFVVSTPGFTPVIRVLTGNLDRVCNVLHFALFVFLSES